MHLKEFKQTWDMYSNGLALGSDFKAKQQKATDSVKLVLQNMIEAKGLTFTDPNWETDKLLTTFTGELIGNVQVELKGGKWRPFEVAPPRDFAPGFLTISTYSFKCNLSTAENFVEILNAVRQLPDVKEKIKDMTDAWEQAMKNRESFLISLRNDVIEPAKDSDYTDPRLFSGVCDNCKHLKDKLASLGA